MIIIQRARTRGYKRARTRGYKRARTRGTDKGTTGSIPEESPNNQCPTHFPSARHGKQKQM
jgi:hypothetical protein